MAIKVAINGFGRIGRVVFRRILETEGIDVIAINDLTPVQTSIHLLKHDSVHGHLNAEISESENGITVNGQNIPISSTTNVDEAAKGFAGADIVFECTGKIVGRDNLQKYIDAGIKYVMISRPKKQPDEVDGTFVLGVNHDTYDPEKHKIVSNASCTTNCLAPVAKVLNDTFGIKHGLMNTIHSYTNDQNTLDQGHKDLRRARSAGVNIIPTTTGAAKAVGLVIPALNGKLDGFAVRVPTPNVSLVDLTVEFEKPATVEAINGALKEASEGALKGFLAYTEEPLVSSDFNGCPKSSTVDSSLTKMIGEDGKFAKVIAWYDNETGYSQRMVDFAKFILTGKLPQ